jgi:hypothetical protein
MVEQRKHHSETVVDSECDDIVDKNGRETVVRLSLFVVLGFLTMCFVVVIGYIFVTNAARDAEARSIRDRVIVIEGKFDTITAGITDLKTTMKETTDVVRQHIDRGR